MSMPFHLRPCPRCPALRHRGTPPPARLGTPPRPAKDLRNFMYPTRRPAGSASEMVPSRVLGAGAWTLRPASRPP
jgi:hypothetical protein